MLTVIKSGNFCVLLFCKSCRDIFVVSSVMSHSVCETEKLFMICLKCYTAMRHIEQRGTVVRYVS